MRLFSSADDSVTVWAAGSDLRAGTTVAVSDLERREIRFASAQDADRYLSADATIPTGTRLLRDVGAGELLPRGAVGAPGSATMIEVPVTVAAEAVPATVRTGSVVDVWVTPEGQGDAESVESALVFDDVVVVAAPRTGGALGPTATRQIIVGVGSADEDGLAAALARVSIGTTVVTKQG